ncbi:PRC-barrel domain-containing protein [Thalassobacillus sp. B23F22_16]|uniref:PRC-barrel domain-containing protein n=1 Tax=Thalassobacillus sp. B23F22_16 TaxID=3459513 RepID=UPI00373E291D
MLYFASTLKNYNIQAKDGELGKVKDLYFDDRKWTVRYLVADTRKWLPGKKVVVSPSGVKAVDTEEQVIHVENNKEDIRNNAALEEKQDFSYEKEMELSDTFGWKQYWTGEFLWGGYLTPMDPMEEPARAAEPQTTKEPPINDNVHGRNDKLRSTENIKGEFKHGVVHGENGKIGYIKDITIDEDTWRIRYLLVDTSEWSTKERVLLSPDWLQSVDWLANDFYIDLKLETIEEGPNYEKDQRVTKEFEEIIYQKYRKEPYWQ